MGRRRRGVGGGGRREVGQRGIKGRERGREGEGGKQEDVKMRVGVERRVVEIRGGEGRGKGGRRNARVREE